MISLLGVGLISWWLTESWATCVIVVFVDLYLLCMMNFHSHYIGNDYNILQDITGVNLRVKQHNKKLDDLQKEIADVKGKLQRGELSLHKDVADKVKQMIEQKATITDDKWGVPSQPPKI